MSRFARESRKISVNTLGMAPLIPSFSTLPFTAILIIPGRPKDNPLYSILAKAGYLVGGACPNYPEKPVGHAAITEIDIASIPVTDCPP
jgi:hypothetical protein